jgi:hypothetical protein
MKIKTENVAVIQNFEKALSDGRNILKDCISAIRDTQGNLDFDYLVRNLTMVSYSY